LSERKKNDNNSNGSNDNQKTEDRDLPCWATCYESIDDRLKQLGDSQDLKQVKQSVPDIRSQLFEVYNLAFYNLDIKFTSRHDDNTTPPLNSQEEC
jgi:hypothetical protein